MPTFALPPDTRAVGTGNPPADMNAVVDVLNNSVFTNTFYIDQYGADPTGVALSDSAWTACYADAAAAMLTHSGSIIQFGAGWYKFSVNKIVVTDERIGVRGQGRYATTIYTTGNTGTIMQVSGIQGGSTANASAPTGNFSVYGWSGGSGLNGLLYGDRANGFLTDVTVTGCSNRGFWFHDTVGLSEGSFVVANSDQNLINYDFDTQSGSTGSFDYSHMFLHNVCSSSPGNNAIGLRFTNGQHMYGGSLHLAGNISATTSNTATCVVIGSGGTDGARIQSTHLQVTVEADTSAGTVKDCVINTASGCGINNCNGIMSFVNTTGTYTAGSVTGGVLKFAGYANGPLFAAHGTKYDPGAANSAAGIFFIYNG